MAALGAVAHHYLARRGTTDEPNKPSSVLGLRLLIITFCVFVVTATLLDYIYGKVVATLAAVEDPNPDVYVRIETDAADESPLSDADEPPSKPITGSLGGTIAHLQARAGRLSRFRGICLYLLSMVAVVVIVLPIGLTLGPGGYIFGGFMAKLLLANLRVGWIHIVISEPSTKSLWSRIPAWRKTTLKIAPAAVIQSLAAELVTFIVGSIAFVTDVHIIPNRVALNKYVFGNLGLLVLYLMLYVLIQMPAEVIFIRVAASMLPEDDEAIVFFDRSFGGKVTPEIIGGEGKIGIIDAWRSFNMDSRMRFIKVVGWNFLIQMAVLFIFGLAFILQIFLFYIYQTRSSGSVNITV